jgi:hypothetical protein
MPAIALIPGSYFEIDFSNENAEVNLRKVGVSQLRTRAIEVAAVAIHPHRICTTLSALKGDNIERWTDPRLLCLPCNLARHTVILNIVALHESSLETPVDLKHPCRSVQLEPNPGGNDRQCVLLPDRY